MKIIFQILFLTLGALNSKAQIISSFSWSSNPVTRADVGANAISAGANATSSANGRNANGLNPGPNRENISLRLAGSNFNLAGIDMSIDFRREESDADFFTRSNYVFGMAGGRIRASFPLTNGATFTTINSGDVYNVPNDRLFHTYRFRYDNNTGVAIISVDGTTVYTYTGITNTALYWTGAGDLTIGANMDGGATNVAILDNMVIQMIPAAGVLPVDLLSFTAAPKGALAAIKWTTTREMNTATFTVERSSNGISFAAIKTVIAVNSFNSTNNYQVTDSTPLAKGFYRLKMTDIDGSYTYSATRQVEMGAAKVTVSCFPNPSTDYVNLKINNNKPAAYSYYITSLDGRILLSGVSKLGTGTQLLSIDLTKTDVKGVLIIQLNNTSDNTMQTFKIVKQ
ncbi:MAG: T9SS type A sorting domain-containing protein [Chitinophagaceae bacterium]|nr:T9SS type A sorting domain-containing protein [Chitinophagaceae bacterium]